ncbi:glycosyltransferase [Candidatus Micrarchaeota archaeon]|nr:glycosyltransferase [Candidatus Micrarchaeota archaeon]
MKPLFSVVIPAFNEERNLQASVGAVRKSAEFARISFEIIVADNNSSDSTFATAKKLGVRVFREKKRVIAAVRNTGAKHARGKIILFVDADTLIPLQTVRLFYKEFSGGAVVVACRVIPRPLGFFENLFFAFFNYLIFLSTFLNASFPGNCVAYDRKTFRKLGGFDEERVASEDQDLSARASRLGKAVFLNNLAVYTSNRRVKKLGFPGLLFDWSKTTLFYAFGIKTRKYRITR